MARSGLTGIGFGQTRLVAATRTRLHGALLVSWEFADVAMTNAEKQKAHRKRTIEKIARYEAALRSVAGCYDISEAAMVARNALNSDGAK